MFWQAFVEKKKNDKKNWEFFVKQEVCDWHRDLITKW